MTKPVTIPAVSAIDPTNPNPNEETNSMPATTTTTTTPTTPTSSPTVTSTVATSTPAPATTSTPVVLASAPPATIVPTVPAGWTILSLSEFRGVHPLKAQLAAIPAVIASLTGSTTYASTFGPAAPPLDAFLRAISEASDWTTIRVGIETYLNYTKVQEGLAWGAAMPQIDRVKAVYDLACLVDTQVAAQYAALGRLLGVRSTSAQKAAATTKKKKAAKAASDAAAVAKAASAVTTPASPATPVAPATATGGAGH